MSCASSHHVIVYCVNDAGTMISELCCLPSIASVVCDLFTLQFLFLAAF